MGRCCGCVVLRKKHKKNKTSRGKRRRVDLTAGSDPPVAPPPTPSPTSTGGPRRGDANQLCQASLVSSEGEYFDCLSDLSDANLDKPPSLQRSSSKQSVIRKSPSPTGNYNEHEHENEAMDVAEGGSKPQQSVFPASLWDLLPWRMRPNSDSDEDTAGPSEERSEAADLMEHESSASSSTLHQNQHQSNRRGADPGRTTDAAADGDAEDLLRTGDGSSFDVCLQPRRLLRVTLPGEPCPAALLRSSQRGTWSRPVRHVRHAQLDPLEVADLHD